MLNKHICDMYIIKTQNNAVLQNSKSEEIFYLPKEMYILELNVLHHEKVCLMQTEAHFSL